MPAHLVVVVLLLLAVILLGLLQVEQLPIDHHVAATTASAPHFPSFPVLSQSKRLGGRGEVFLVLQSNFEAFAFGWNENGQLGLNSTTYATVPQKMLGASAVKDLCAGKMHSCVLVGSEGRVLCAGAGRYGQAGLGTSDDSLVIQPVAVAGTTAAGGVGEVFCGRYTSFALMAGTGQVYGWGRNSYGALGINNTDHTFIPTHVAALAAFNVTAVGAGRLHSCFLVSTGLVLCSGENTDGELGDGGPANQATPVAVDLSALQPQPSFSAVACGNYISCALSTTGEVYCWGMDRGHELGNTAPSVLRPTLVLGLGGVESLWTGSRNAFMIMRGVRNAAVFGADKYGVFGMAHVPEYVHTPAPFAQNVSGIEEIRGGFLITCLLNTAGEVWCTGYDHYREQGVGGQPGGTLVLAEVLGLPTAVPTQSPTSSKPTKSPSRSPTSSTPTAALTSFKPTKSPSRSPTSSTPTAAPTSSKPTMAPTRSPTAAPTTSVCLPAKGLNKAQCAKLTKTCANLGAVMTWAGAGCRVNGKLQHDGGCQCKDYCGYTCSKSCNLSSGGRCKWNAKLKVCTVAETGKPYVPRDTMYCPRD